MVVGSFVSCLACLVEKKMKLKSKSKVEKLFDVFSRAGSHVHSGSAGDFGVKSFGF